MGRNILFFIIGALAFAVLASKPIFAKSADLLNIEMAMSTRELALFDRIDGTIYYYDKNAGNLLRTQKIEKLGGPLTTAK